MESEKNNIDNIELIYTEWCGENRHVNDCKPVHDSTETIEFAKYYYEKITNKENLKFANVIVERYNSHSKLVTALEHAQVELSALYKRLNIKNSNVLREIESILSDDDLPF